MADAVGNRNGPRAVFVYTTDGGTAYNVSLDDSVANAAGNPESSANNPSIRATGRRPFQLRYILCSLQSDPSVSKRVTICNAANLLFARDVAGVITINAVDWDITGRVGEKASFLVPTGAI
jgi:hypothetical protein